MPGSAMPNLNDPNFDEPRETLDGFTAYRARLGHQLGTERIGLSQWRIPAGQVAYPYHFHLAEEEVLVLLEGTLLLRTPAGWRRVQPRRRRPLPASAKRAPTSSSTTRDDDARFLAISTHGQPDVVIYPDEGKICAAERTPDGRGLKMYFKHGRAVPYDEGIDASGGPRCGPSVS